MFLSAAIFAVLVTISEGEYLFVQAYVVHFLYSLFYSAIFLFPSLFIIASLNKIKLEGFLVAGMALAALPTLWIMLDMDGSTSFLYSYGGVNLIEGGQYTSTGLALTLGDLWRDILFGGLCGYVYWRFVNPGES